MGGELSREGGAETLARPLVLSIPVPMPRRGVMPVVGPGETLAGPDPEAGALACDQGAGKRSGPSRGGVSPGWCGLLAR